MSYNPCIECHSRTVILCPQKTHQINNVCKTSHLTHLALLHRGRHTNFFWGGVQICCLRPTFYKQRPISHNIGIGHKQKSWVLYVHYVQLLITTINKRGSTVNLCMLDISKAFAKVNRYCMFIKLINRSLPLGLVLLNILINWYDKCAVFVRIMFIEMFYVMCGVRQGGVLSPSCFQYVNGMIRMLCWWCLGPILVVLCMLTIWFQCRHLLINLLLENDWHLLWRSCVFRHDF